MPAFPPIASSSTSQDVCLLTRYASSSQQAGNHSRWNKSRHCTTAKASATVSATNTPSYSASLVILDTILGNNYVV